MLRVASLIYSVFLLIILLGGCGGSGQSATDLTTDTLAETSSALYPPIDPTTAAELLTPIAGFTVPAAAGGQACTEVASKTVDYIQGTAIDGTPDGDLYLTYDRVDHIKVLFDVDIPLPEPVYFVRFFPRLDDTYPDPLRPAYKMYKWQLPGFSGAHELHFDWDPDHAPQYLDPGTWAEVRLFLANPAMNEWSEIASSDPYTFPIPSIEDYLDEDDYLMLDVVLTGEDWPCYLASLSISGTSVPTFGVQDYAMFRYPKQVPPLFVEQPIPNTYTLEEWIPAAKRQKGLICEAYGTAYAALNTENAVLYEDYGWDLSDDHYLANPYYLYYMYDVVHGGGLGSDRKDEALMDYMISYGVATYEEYPFELDDPGFGDPALLPPIDEEILAVDIEGWCGISNGEIYKWIAKLNKAIVYELRKVNQQRHTLAIVGYDKKGPGGSDDVYLTLNGWNDELVWTSLDEYYFHRSFAIYCEFDPRTVELYCGEPFTGIAPPTGITASTDRDGEILVSWEPAADAQYYRIYRDSEDRLFCSQVADTSWTDDAPAEGYCHAYWVEAVASDESAAKSRPMVGWAKSSNRNVISTAVNASPRTLAIGKGADSKLRLGWVTNGPCGHTLHLAQGFDINKQFITGEIDESTTGVGFNDLSFARHRTDEAGIMYERISPVPAEDGLNYTYFGVDDELLTVAEDVEEYMTGGPFGHSSRMAVDSENWYVLHIVDDLWLHRALRLGAGVWEDANLDWPLGGVLTAVSQDHLTTAYSLEPGDEPWRAVVTRDGPTIPWWEAKQLLYVLNSEHDLRTSPVPPPAEYGLTAHLGTAYVHECNMYGFGWPNSVDDDCVPAVFTSASNSDEPASATSAVVSAAIAGPDDWLPLEQVELCTAGGNNEVGQHGVYGKALCRRTDKHIICVYHSGVQNARHFAEDSGDLKLAYMLQAPELIDPPDVYAPGEWAIETIDETPGGEDVAIWCDGNGNLYVLYVRKHADGREWLMLWTKDEEDWPQ